METPFSENAAMLKNIYISNSPNFSTAIAWKVAVDLNEAQNVIVINVSAMDYAIELQSLNQKENKPPYSSIDYHAIKHFYQFDKYANTVVMAVINNKCPHYQALAFLDVDSAVVLCHILARKNPWPEYMLNKSAEAYNANSDAYNGKSKFKENFPVHSMINNDSNTTQSRPRVAPKSRCSDNGVGIRKKPEFMADVSSCRSQDIYQQENNDCPSRVVRLDKKHRDIITNHDRSRRNKMLGNKKSYSDPATCSICDEYIQTSVCEHCRNKFSKMHLNDQAKLTSKRAPSQKVIIDNSDKKYQINDEFMNRYRSLHRCGAATRNKNLQINHPRSDQRPISKFQTGNRGNQQRICTAPDSYSSEDNSSIDENKVFGHYRDVASESSTGINYKQKNMQRSNHRKHVTILSDSMDAPVRKYYGRREYTIRQSPF